jgi:hypothetical protein
MPSNLLLLAGRGGKDEKERGWLPAEWCHWGSFRANYVVGNPAAAILGQKGGPSSTSMSEALFEVLRRCSTPSHLQVVRPRRRLGGWRQHLAVGTESQASSSFSDLGFALRSPAEGGGLKPGPDCFSSFSSRVLSVICEVFSVILKSCAVDATDDLFVICTHLFLE